MRQVLGSKKPQPIPTRPSRHERLAQRLRREVVAAIPRLHQPGRADSVFVVSLLTTRKTTPTHVAEVLRPLLSDSRITGRVGDGVFTTVGGMLCITGVALLMWSHFGEAGACLTAIGGGTIVGGHERRNEQLRLETMPAGAMIYCLVDHQPLAILSRVARGNDGLKTLVTFNDAHPLGRSVARQLGIGWHPLSYFLENLAAARPRQTVSTPAPAV